MKTIEANITVHASKDSVWDLLFNRFGEVNLFNPLIEGSHHTSGVQGEVGCERQCDLDANNSVHEKITAARGNDGFDIAIIDGGLPMMDEMKASFELSALDAHTTRVDLQVAASSRPRFMIYLMKGMMARMFFKMLIGLKYHLETGKTVSKKDMKLISRWYKSQQGAPLRVDRAAA